VGVNRDASLFCRAPGNDLVEPRGGVALPDYSGSAVRRTAASGAGPVGRSLRHNKSGRGRSSCRSAPASDSPRKGTAALISRRYGRNRDRHMDDRRDCRDTAPACVPSTCGARRRCGTAKFEIGAVPAPRKQQATTRRPGRQSARRRPAEQQHQLSIGSPFEAPLPARANAGKRPGRHPAPDRRGFRPPSTAAAEAGSVPPVMVGPALQSRQAT
jgi:hypothetical protein